MVKQESSQLVGTCSDFLIRFQALILTHQGNPRTKQYRPSLIPRPNNLSPNVLHVFLPLIFLPLEKIKKKMRLRSEVWKPVLVRAPTLMVHFPLATYQSRQPTGNGEHIVETHCWPWLCLGSVEEMSP